MKRRIILLGPPASGKGTQASMIAESTGLPTASTGAMMREEQANGTDLGREATRWTSEGKLFPDEMALRLLERWFDQGHWDGFVLDGFPRTVNQARILDELLADRNLSLDAAIHLRLSPEVIHDRVLNRVTCIECGATFNSSLHHVSPGDDCPRCGARLERRADDSEDALNHRLSEHSRLTEPVLDYYRAAGILSEIDASRDRSVIFDEILSLIGAEVEK